MKKYPSLNGLRAISIFLVILHHLSSEDDIFNKISGVRWFFPFLRIITDGHLGVNVFFVISGFLITSLLLREEDKNKKISFGDFYIRRILRIFPAYYFLLTIYFLLQLMHFINISKMSWLTAVTYTVYFKPDIDRIIAHGWSLSVEEHFYLLWPFFFARGDGFRKKTALIFILIVPFIRIFAYFHPVFWLSELSIFTRIDAIAIGCFCALYKNEIIKRLSPYWTPIFYSSIALLCLSNFLIFLMEKINLGFIFIPFGKTHGSFANILIALLMMYSVFGPERSWFKFLNNKIINNVGLLSYSIYLWQQFFIYNKSFWICNYPQSLVMIMGAALFSYYIIEKPFLKLKTKFSRIN
jgi:peptidoglycan/LPS O-acetylase OafA/YrhL